MKKELHLTHAELANSNIISLASALLLRCISGPLCDVLGPRRVFAGLILLGCIPIGLAPLVKDATGLYICRFFIGILGATFVPCQVWCTGFFDKNIVGTANAVAGGWGNAGGGITYFIMPAVFESLVVHYNLSPSKAWRVTFVVPLVCLLACAIAMLSLCPDTPLGPWSEREQQIKNNLKLYGVEEASIVLETPKAATEHTEVDKVTGVDMGTGSDLEGQLPCCGPNIAQTKALKLLQNEIIVMPNSNEIWAITLSPQTFFHVMTYACSFGSELAINSILGLYLRKSFPYLDRKTASSYAAIFGFLNFVTRPLGGMISDALYNKFGRSLWLKKGWIVLCGIMTGVMLIIIGTVKPSEESGRSLGTMVGLLVLLAFFDEAGNGANFALVPHVHPSANGLVSGLTGSGGNLGGIIFATIFRFMKQGRGFAEGLWVIGVINVGVNVAVCWIPPLPRGQIGGR